MSDQFLPPKAVRKRLAKTIQEVMAGAYPHEALTRACSAYAWMGQQVLREVLGLDYTIVTGACRWLDREGFHVGWNPQKGQTSYHAWLERQHPQGREIVDLTSAFWPDIAAQRESILTVKPPAYVWDLESNLPPDEWLWEPMPGLPASLANSAKTEELEPLAAAASARAREELAKLKG